MLRNLFKFLADLRFAIFNLLIIILLSIIGTVIEQDQTIETYKSYYPIKNFSVFSWNTILQLGLDHIYTTWWFIFCIFLFGLSLLSCTFLQQFPTLRVAKRCYFFRNSNQFNFLKISSYFNTQILNHNIVKIKKKKYSIYQQKNIFYCYKGLNGKFGPIFVHFSMILILFGAILGAFSGFTAQEIIPKTEIFSIQNILKIGKITIIPEEYLRINDFWITYTKKMMVTQFYSDISILNNNGFEILQQTIYVNSPSTYQGIHFYQTNWNLIAIRIQYYNFETFFYPLIETLTTKEKIWITWIANKPNFNNGFILLIKNLQGYSSLYDNTGYFLGNIELNEILNSTYKILFLDIISSTGLQIKIDPGLSFIYSGFLILILSTLISYLTYSQLWILKKKKKICAAGNTNRAKFDFEIEFLDLIKN